MTVWQSQIMLKTRVAEIEQKNAELMLQVHYQELQAGYTLGDTSV
jgi:hypothetical protein